MKKIIVVLLLFTLTASCFAQGITFMSGTFAEAIEKAKAENKILFVDVYADWCEPCKMISKQVFPLKEAGDYFNKKFVNYKLNADLPENKDAMIKYDIQGIPALLFINQKGELENKLVGMCNVYTLLRAARIATKEHKTEDELYELYKKDKSDLSIQQAILKDSPYFMPNLQPALQERWWLRVKGIYDEYLKVKGLDNMMNTDDFNIIAMFHDKMLQDDPIINYMVSNFSRICESVDKNNVSQYVAAMHSNCVIELARSKNSEYSKVLERMVGDMKPIYTLLQPNLEKYYEAYKVIADANYEIYANKNTAKYIQLMESYISMQGKPTVDSYAMALETIFNAQKGKLTPEGFNKCILWIDDALKITTEVDTQVGLVLAMGDCFLGLSNTIKAKECYNQAYMLVLKSDNQNFVGQIQQTVKKKLAAITE